MGCYVQTTSFGHIDLGLKMSCQESAQGNERWVVPALHLVEFGLIGRTIWIIRVVPMIKDAYFQGAVRTLH